MTSERLMQQYERDGAVCVRGAVDASDVPALLANIDSLIADRNDRWTTIRSGGFSDRRLSSGRQAELSRTNPGLPA